MKQYSILNRRFNIVKHIDEKEETKMGGKKVDVDDLTRKARRPYFTHGGNSKCFT